VRTGPPTNLSVEAISYSYNSGSSTLIASWMAPEVEKNMGLQYIVSYRKLYPLEEPWQQASY